MFFLLLLIASLNANMTCQSGWMPVYPMSAGNYQVLCCRSGVAKGEDRWGEPLRKCSPVSPYDYYANCQEMFHLSDDECNCGSLCSGAAIWEVFSGARCEGECSCPSISGCNETRPPTTPTRAPDRTQSIPSSSSSRHFVTPLLVGILISAFILFCIV